MIEMADLSQATSEIIGELQHAKRPLLIYGAGVRGCSAKADELRELLGIPLVVTWGARDRFPGAEAFGTHGGRGANFAVQTADYVLTIGTRLDTKATGSPASSFAPRAKLVMVDIDPGELDKMGKIGRPLYRAICADAGTFLDQALGWGRAVLSHDGSFPDWSAWRAKIEDWRARFPSGYEEAGINPYSVVKDLSKHMRSDDVLVSDTGCSLAWVMQAFNFRGQEFIHPFNQTPMGCGLGSAVGAAFATNRRVVLVTGDGGLSLGISELATIERHSLPVKIVLFNNYGHAMCRQTQRQWLGGEYPATSYAGGLASPPFTRIAAGYGLQVKFNELAWLLEDDLPGMAEFQVPRDFGVSPQARFGKPIEDADPALADLAEILAEAA